MTNCFVRAPLRAAYCDSSNPNRSLSGHSSLFIMLTDLQRLALIGHNFGLARLSKTFLAIGTSLFTSPPFFGSSGAIEMTGIDTKGPVRSLKSYNVSCFRYSGASTVFTTSMMYFCNGKVSDVKF